MEFQEKKEVVCCIKHLTTETDPTHLSNCVIHPLNTLITRQVKIISGIWLHCDYFIWVYLVLCRNTIANRIKPPRDHTPPHNQWGIYLLTCNTCNLSYVGQTSRSLSISYKSIYVTSEATIPNQHTPYTFFKTDTNTAPWIIIWLY